MCKWQGVSPGLNLSQECGLAYPTMAGSPQPTSRLAKFGALAGTRWIWITVVAATSLGIIAGASALFGIVRGLLFSGGLVLISASVAGAFWLRSWLDRQSSAKEQAYDLALGAKAR